MNHLEWWIQKTKKVSHSTISLFLRKFSVIVAHYCNKIWIEPHYVVIWRSILFWWLSLFLLYQNNYYLQLLWLVSLFFNSFFDMVDGDIARNYNKITKYWKFLDEWLDGVLLNLIILLFTIKFVAQWYETMYIVWWILALFGIIGSTKMTTIFETQFFINCVGWNETLEKSIKSEKRDNLSKLLYEFITPKSVLLWLFSNFRYYLLFWIIFGFMPLALLLYAFAINIRRIVLFITLWAYYQDTHDIKIFKLFHDIECKNSYTIS